MINAIVVDDEKLVRKGFIALTDWQSYGIEIVGEAGDGKRALQLLDQQPIDLMFVDITMPGISGFELMKKAQQKHDSVEFVILTCHHEFNYIQEALRLGAIDYIVKTLLNKDNVHETMQRITGRLKRESGRKAADIGLFYGAVIFRSKDQNRGTNEVRAMLPKGTTLLQLSPYLHLCHQESAGSYVNLEELHERLHQDWKIIGVTPSDRHTKQEAEEFIREKLEHYLFYAAMPSSSTVAIKELEHLYTAANDSEVQSQLQVEWQQFKWLIYSKNWSDLNDKVLSLRPEPTFIIELMMELYHSWSLYMKWGDEEQERITANKNPSTWNEQEQMLSELALLVQRRLADVSLSHEVVLCLIRALQHMKMQACESLTQSDIAQGVNMSRSYFSQCFKLFVGNSFSQVLRKMRIDQAKHLLLESSLSIYEIASRVGFDDNKYFSRTFRERVGMYPTEYRIHHQLIEVNSE